MSFSVVIPARFGSLRLPGKPLVNMLGKPMIQRTYEQALKSNAERVVVATDDQRVAEAVSLFGGEVCMTSATHPSGTDRLHEVVTLLQWHHTDVVVNVQGDEPLIPPATINQVAANQGKERAFMSTLYEPIVDLEEVLNPNVVKVVTDNMNKALYFSRAPIPWSRDAFVNIQEATSNSKLTEKELTHYKRHVGLYAYSVDSLNQFVTWSPSMLEQTEKLEQLRVLVQGREIHIEKSCEPIPAGVDTQHDLQRVIAHIKNSEKVV